VSLVVPLASLQVHSINIASIFRLFLYLFVCLLVHEDEVKLNNINCNVHLPRVVLQSSRQEGLREEESRYPEYFWCAIVNPVRQEYHSVIQVLSP
jgi:hypothetical protein